MANGRDRPGREDLSPTDVFIQQLFGGTEWADGQCRRLPAAMARRRQAGFHEYLHGHTRIEDRNCCSGERRRPAIVTCAYADAKPDRERTGRQIVTAFLMLARS